MAVIKVMPVVMIMMLMLVTAKMAMIVSGYRREEQTDGNHHTRCQGSESVCGFHFFQRGHERPCGDKEQQSRR